MIFHKYGFFLLSVEFINVIEDSALQIIFQYREIIFEYPRELSSTSCRIPHQIDTLKELTSNEYEIFFNLATSSYSVLQNIILINIIHSLMRIYQIEFLQIIDYRNEIFELMDYIQRKYPSNHYMKLW